MLAKLLNSVFTWDFIKKGLKFGVTSLSACIINFGVNIIGHECFGISVNILYPIALVLVSISSFLQFRFFVFPDASKRNAVKQGWQFILSSIVFRLLEWTLFFILYNVVALSFHWWYVCCIVIVQTTGTISKFFFYNYFIFGHGNSPSSNGRRDSSPSNNSCPFVKKYKSMVCQIFLAALCTAIILLLCRNMFRSSEKYVKLSFTVHYTNQIGNHWQVFYRSNGSKELHILSPVLLRSDKKTLQSIAIPCKTLEWIRLDFGSVPGKVELSSFSLWGRRSVSLDGLIKQNVYQIAELQLKKDGLTCSSSNMDPHISFQLKKPISGIRIWDYWALVIVICSAFITFLAAARLITVPGLSSRWLYTADCLLAALFLAALFIPMSHIDDRKYSAAEKRSLASFRPLVDSKLRINYQFGRNFESWFNDHFFGRAALLDLSAFLFLKTKSPLQPYGNVYTGFDDWYFYSKENAIRNYHNLDLFSENELARAAENLRKIQDICRKRGKKLYLVIIPDKHKVYGEYFPGAPKIRPDSQSRSRQLEHYLQKNASIEVINLLDTLLENKKQGFLFWKNSTHWNEMGAYVGYLEIMRRIRKDFPDVQLSRIYTIKPKKATFRGDLNALSNGDLIPDKTLYPLPHFSVIYKASGDSIGKAFGSGQLFNPKGKYNVLILRDSFSTSLLPYMGNSFRSITALWSGYKLPQSRIKAFEEADIVIFECVDRLLPFLLPGIHATRVNLEQGVK